MNQVQPSILITDDDRQFRETLGNVLAPCGFRTLLASDGEEAVRIVQTTEVHLLLVDMNMPRLTGLETLLLVKQIKAMLPCILLSAKMDESLRAEAVRERAFSVLSKPVTRLQITQTVQRALMSTYGWQ